MRALFERDRGVFYDRIAHDPRFLAGWAGDPAATRNTFTELRDHADDRLRFARYASYLVLINHAVAGFDALRAARLHNRPLQERVQLRLGGGRYEGGSELTAALETRF
jgi:hypothetical protein